MINYFVIKVFIFFIMIMVSDKKVGGLLYFYSLSISVSVSVSVSLSFSHTHTHTHIYEKSMLWVVHPKIIRILEPNFSKFKKNMLI